LLSARQRCEEEYPDLAHCGFLPDHHFPFSRPSVSMLAVFEIATLYHALSSTQPTCAPTKPKIETPLVPVLNRVGQQLAHCTRPDLAPHKLAPLLVVAELLDILSLRRDDPFLCRLDLRLCRCLCLR